VEKKIYVNGSFVNASEASVSVLDHGLLYGDGVFEGIRAYDGKVFRLGEHVDRLFMSARTIMLEIPMTREEMTAKIVESLRENGLRDGYVRVVVTRGKGDLGLDPRKCPSPGVIIIADSISLYPEDFYEKGIEIVTVSTRRNMPDALSPQVKSLNYLNNIMAKIEASNAGVLEALMLNAEGYVAECSGDNIFIVVGDTVITPPTTAGALEGITRDVIIGLAKKDYRVREELFTLPSTYNADEMFLTGTAAEVIPVVKVDGRTIGAGRPGSVTRKLIKAFRQVTREEGTPI